VGFFQNDQFILLANDEGQREIPSYVTFTEQGAVTGLKAKNQEGSNPENTIYEFRSASLPAPLQIIN
jgi:molecular chaperone DnaK (HSP70)